VRECAVVVREGRDEDAQLVAYVVADEQHAAGGTAKVGAGSEGSATEDEKQAVVSERVELCPSVAEYFVYDDYLYETLTHDERRNESYRAAINRSVRNKVVLDIGTGPDAILARLCLEAGARRVYAIEILERTYRQAVRTVERLGLADRLILIHGDATRVELPEQVDVCVSEIVGSIGGSEGAAVIINDARRFLTSDGVMIPQRSTTRVAAATLPDELLTNPGFSDLSADYAAKIFAQVGRPFDLRLCIRNFPPSHLLSETGIFEDLDFDGCVATEYRRDLRLRITRRGRCDGFLVWLNLYPGAGEVIDILEPGYSWFPIYFPVFHPGVEVEAGDLIVAVCSGKLSANGINPDYRIEGRLIRADGREIEFAYESPHHQGGYRQTPFYRSIFDADGTVRRRDEPALTSRSLRAGLQQRLPAYMIPRAFVLLDELPLTPNGKLDRRALPAPETMRAERGSVVAPRTPLEQSLAAIWAQLLDVQPLGIHDNFFELGGHSLLATRLISQVRQTFAVELPLRRLFEIPTIAMLAAEIEQLRLRDERGPQEPAIKPLARAARRMKRSAVEDLKGAV
jgi:precorrin-6B methylase 2/acyl carrier protein